MKRVLSLLLAMAIVLSCFATCMVFSVSAAQTDYLNVVGMSGHGSLGSRQGIDGTDKAAGDSALGVSYKASTTYRTEPGAAYVSNYTLTQAYNGDYILSSVKADEVFKNNVAAPEYLRYQAKLSVTCENSVIMYVEIPNYEAADETWGFGLFEPTAVKEFTNASGSASRKFKRTEDITEGFSYLSVDGKKWVNGTMYKVADGEKVMKTDLPSGFKGYIRFDLSLIPILRGDNVLTTDVTTLYELDIAYNAVGTGDFVVGGLMYATTNANSTVLNFNGLGVSQLANVNIPEYIKVLGLSGNNWSLGNKQGINGTSYPAGDTTLGVKYTGDKTYRAEAGENYVSDYANTNLAPNYSGNYIFSSNTENVFINDAAAPEYFRYQSKLDVTENDAIIMYVEIPDYTAAGQKWGLGLYEPSEEFKNANKNNRFFKRNEDLTEGFSYLSIDDKEWKNGTIYKLAEGEKVMKTDLPAGFKGYIRFDLSKINTVAHDANQTVMNDITWLNELNFAYNAVGAGNFVLGGLMYRTTTADDVVFNFNDVGFAPLTNEVANYINVSCLSGNNWNIANKLGVDGTSYPNGDSAVGVKYIGSNTYRAEPGEKYVEYYENSTFHYSGNNIFSSNTNKVFINDETAPQYFRYISKLAVTEESSVIMYVELPDYELASEKWGLGLYESASEFTNAKGNNRFFDRSKDITEGFTYLSIDSKEWKNGTIYAQAEGEKVMKTDLPSGFKGYIRFDLSKIDTIAHDTNHTVMNDVTMLNELDFAFNAVGTNDFVIGGLMYAATNSDSTVLNFNYLGFYPLVDTSLPEYIKVSGMSGYNSGLGNKQGINGTGYAAGATALSVTYAYNKVNYKEPGAAYVSNYTNTVLAPAYNGTHVFTSKSGVFKNNVAAPEYFRYQAQLDVSEDDSVILYVEVPDYKAAGETWGLGFYRPADAVGEFRNASGYARFFKRTENITEGFSYLSVDAKEWKNGTIYAQAEGEKVMKTDLPSGFKGYIRFDLSKIDTVIDDGATVRNDITKLHELDFAYNAVGAGDFVLGGLIYRTTNANDLVFNFNNLGLSILTNNILSVRAQNLITDKANTTNATGTNIKLTKNGAEASTTAVMKLAKSGGLFLDDGYAASFTPNGTVGNGIMQGVNRLNYNTIETNPGLQLKAGVNKFMFYVELPDVRDFESITDEHSALAIAAINFTNGATISPYGEKYEYMDIRDGVWHESEIIKDNDKYEKNGVFSGLPTDGFKGYIKVDLNGLVGSQTTTYTISSIKLSINRFSWGRPLTVGGFYAVDVDSSATTPYFMDTKTGEMLTTKVVAGDFSGNEEYDAADLTLAIKYLIKADSVTGAQTARASSFDNPKADFTVVSLVQLKKILSGLTIGFNIDKDLEASTSESDVILTAQNPDRGFRMKSFVSIESDPADFSTLNLTQWDKKFNDAADLTNPGVWVNPTINKVYFRLDSFVDGEITEDAFTNIQKVFDITKSQGKTLIVRFYYNSNFEPDSEGKITAPVSQATMLAHMQQIKDSEILKNNSDVLHAVEAGFLGRYGEWHTYYDNYYINPAYKDSNGKLDISKVWAVETYDEYAIIRGILDMVPEDVYVLLRAATYRDMFLSSNYAKAGDAERLGLHNDSFMSAPTTSEMGTTAESVSLRNAAATAPMSGEYYWGVELEKDGIEFDGLEAILNFQYYRQNTFSIFHNSWEDTATVAQNGENSYIFGYTPTRQGDMSKWAVAPITEEWLQANDVFYAPTWFKDKDGNTVARTQFEFVRDYLGYKLEAKHLKIEGKKARGAEVKVEIDLVNYGFSAPFNMTSELVVLDSKNNIVSRVPAGNALEWVNTDTELVTHKINATITLPEAAGKYKIALYVHNRAGTGAYLGNNIEQVDGFNILASFGI